MKLLVLASLATAALGTAAVAVASELLTPAVSQTAYQPIQGISHDFAAKSLRGYFLPQDGKCLLVMMISDKFDPDQSMPGSPTRVQVALDPGQLATIDSEAEGSLHSLTLSCGENAGILSVTGGNGTEAVAVH
jgi:hypothetical protein